MSKTSYKEFHRFQPAHPQYTSHCMKKITDSEQARVPVLVGIPIPRADRDEDKQAHCVAMLSLFKPWSEDLESPLKDSDKEWESAYTEMLLETRASYRRTIDNMQLVYQAREAKHDFSAMRRK
ncbi:hypothetical protein C8R45DRAFT_809532, partial [Mycena sanguinolenta]